MSFNHNYWMSSLLLFFVVVPASLNAAWLDSAITAYNTGNYQEAIRILEPKADAGDAEANYYLGQIYRMGRGVEPDNARAKQYYLEAADGGHIDAQRNLGSLYFFEADEGAENPEAVKWLTRAAEKGDAWSQWFLGKMYINGQGVEKDIDQAYKWFNAAGEQNHQQAKQAAEEIRKQRSSPEPDSIPTVDVDAEISAVAEISNAANIDSSSDDTAEQALSETSPETSPETMTEALPESVPDTVSLESPKPVLSGYIVQLAAFTSRPNAERGKAILEDKLSDLLSDNPISIHEATLSDTKSNYKLRIGPFENSSQAFDLCSEIKKKGEDCFVSKLSN